MSRYTKEFDKHPFHSAWGRLYKRVEELSIDDVTQVDSIDELARLKKVIIYVDEFIKNSDPELVPLSLWSGVQSYSQNCLGQLDQYQTSKNVGYINQANKEADNLLSTVKPYYVQPKQALTAAKRAGTAYEKAANKFMEVFQENVRVVKKDFESQQKEITETYNGIKQQGDAINELYNNTFTINSGTKHQIDTYVNEINSKCTEIKKLHSELLVGDQRNVSVKDEVYESLNNINNNKKQSEKLLEDTRYMVDDLLKFYTKSFGEEDEDGKLSGGLEEKLLKLKEDLENFQKIQHDRYEALNDQIETLLPGATSAGLSSAYKEMKESFDDQIEKSSKQFYVAIGILLVISFVFTVDSITFSPFSLSFKSIGGWEDLLKSLGLKIPFYVPALWFTYYATKRRSEAQRLQQEYAHKESLASSINSYKDQIEKLGEESNELLKELLSKAVESVSFNASETLNGKHGEKMPLHEIIESTAKEVVKAKKPF